jgi:2-phospho-L-lactate guanylyltransferase
MNRSSRDIWAIVPVKIFAGAKQRLSSVLSAHERARLAEAMFRDVLAALRPVPQLAGIAVVTADPAAAKIATSFGARHIHDAVESGVNAAVTQGLDALHHEESAVAVIAADVPFVTSTEIANALSALEYDPIVLAPAETDGGTNLLAMRHVGLIEPCFGERSFARHQQLARSAKLSCGVFRAPGLGHDIDRADDLLAPAGCAATRAATLLKQFNVTARWAILSNKVS